MAELKLRDRFNGRVNSKTTLEDLTRWNFSKSKKKRGDREAQKKTLAEKVHPLRWEK